jgi:uncharacterized membrane protein
MKKKMATRIILKTLGVCSAIFMLIGIPLISHDWILTAVICGFCGAIALIIGLISLVNWAWSE